MTTLTHEQATAIVAYAKRPNASTLRKAALTAHFIQHAMPIIGGRLRASAGTAMNFRPCAALPPSDRPVVIDHAAHYEVVIPAEVVLDDIDSCIRSAGDAIVARQIADELGGWNVTECDATVEPFPRVGMKSGAMVLRFSIHISLLALPPAVIPPDNATDEYMASLHAEAARNRASRDALAAR